MAPHYFTIITLTLLLLLESVTSLKCYVCTSKHPEEKCDDLFDKKTHSPDVCDLPTAVCLKQKLPAVGRFPESTHRSCVEEEYCKNYASVSQFCEICKEDFCNSSGKTVPTMTFIAFWVIYYLSIR